MLDDANSFGQFLDLIDGNENFERPCGVAQTGGGVDRRTDVVVALEQERITGCETDAQRQWRACGGGSVLEFHREDHGIGLVDRNDHQAVTQPLRDTNPTFGGHVACHGPKSREKLACGVVALGFREMREPRQVDESEGPGHAHAPSGYAM